MLFPRMLLHRPPRGGLISKAKLSERFDKFVRGEWNQLIRASMQCDEIAVVSRRRKGRRGNDQEHRATRALNFVQVGELSSARQALERVEIAPGNDDTLKQLCDISKRPDRLRDPIPQEVLEYVPTIPFDLDETMFLMNVRFAKWGFAGGPSGMPVEHLCPFLDSPRDHRLFHNLAESLARGMLLESTVESIRLGRMTALSKRDGGVRGIVTGDVVRRWWPEQWPNRWERQWNRQRLRFSTPSQPVQGVNALLTHYKVSAIWTRTPRSYPLTASAGC